MRAEESYKGTFRKCASKKCGKSFQKARSTQEYCCDECHFIDLGVGEFFKPRDYTLPRTELMA
jgi:hypothetical protein